MEAHKERLKNLCRVCGRKPTRGYVHKKCSDKCQGVLSSVLGIEVSTEPENIYPPGVCNGCYLILRQKQKGDIRATNLTPHTWLPHSEEECQICTALPSTGGKPKRRKVTLEVKGRPNADDNTRAILAKLADLNVPNYGHAPLNTTCFLSNPILPDLTCTICQCIPNQPVEVSTCRHYMCLPCIVRSCESENTLVCQCTNVAVKASHLNSPPSLVLKLYDSLLVTCKCGQIIELKNLDQHLASKCAKIEIPPPSLITVHNLLQSKSDTPSQMQTHTMGLLVDKLLPNNGSLTYRSTSGKVIATKLTYYIIIYLSPL